MGYLFFITKRKRCVLGLVACWTWAFFLQSKPNRERHIFQGINFNQDCLVGNEGLWWTCWFIVLCVFQRPGKRKWASTTDMEWNTSLVDHRTSIHPGAPDLRAQQSQWDGAVSHLYTIWKGAEGGLFFFNKFLFLLAALGLHYCVRAFPSHIERGLLCVVVRRLLIMVASLPQCTGPRARGLSSCSSQALECGLP